MSLPKHFDDAIQHAMFVLAGKERQSNKEFEAHAAEGPHIDGQAIRHA